MYLVYPVIGIFLAGWFVRNIVKDDISHGVTKILYAISRRQGRIKRHNIWSSTIASAITIGFGGSVGAEAPIVLTGSAIGSNLGSVFKMEHRTLMLLVGCGAAGAIAGIFKAPIAGLVFTLEVLMIDLTMSSLLPLLISAVTAATVSYITTGTEAMFKFNLDQAFELERIPYVILLGIFCGLISLYFTRAMNSIEGVFGKLKNPYQKLAFGGVMLSVLIFLFPPRQAAYEKRLVPRSDGGRVPIWRICPASRNNAGRRHGRRSDGQRPLPRFRGPFLHGVLDAVCPHCQPDRLKGTIWGMPYIGCGQRLRHCAHHSALSAHLRPSSQRRSNETSLLPPDGGGTSLRPLRRGPPVHGTLLRCHGQRWRGPGHGRRLCRTVRHSLVDPRRGDRQPACFTSPL